MSSGLQVETSKLKPEWENERIWINLKSLGWEALPRLRKQTTTTVSQSYSKNNINDSNDANQVMARVGDNRHDGVTANDDDDNDDDNYDDDTDYFDYDDGDDDNDARDKFSNLANMWVQHMMLSPKDLTTEHPDVRVRPLPGLEGVDYLSPGALTNHVSYVFGPLIKAMVKAGYTKDVDLNAAPYDWRIPYRELEERDSYFTNVKKTVEDMYERNDKTPIVLLCHSMGAKVGEYFLRWVYQNDPIWTETYVHTYFPVGGAHLGAPKALRSMLTGDRMGLDTFLSLSDALHFGRSLGSGIGL
ncbi:MAG: hypothetical protein SGARI_002120, partial [Bacillariaceae sp.]